MRVFICDKCKKTLNETDEKYFLVSSQKWDFDTRDKPYPRAELCGECIRKLAKFISGEEE